MKKYFQEDIDSLKVWANVIRKDIIHMVSTANSGHPGGSLSAADLVAALYFHVMNVDPKKPNWPKRDRFILSKGHACPVLYAALAEKGYYEKKHLDTLRRFHSILQGHPDMKKTPGVDMTTGSLGNGLSIGIGMAMAAKTNNQDYRVYVMLGDGEIQEGVVWEAAMTAAHYKIDNIIAIIDDNGLQVDGYTNDIMNVSPIADKWKAFGWNVIEIDGHDMEQILDAFANAERIGEPVVIVAKTVKGKGVSFMENICEWHGMAPDKKQTTIAIEELEKRQKSNE